MPLFDQIYAFAVSPFFPLLLFFGALADAIIGIGFFIHAELFFFAGGYVVAQNDSYYLIAILWSGAWFGDLFSFYIGRHYGSTLCKKVIFPQLSRRRAYRLCKAKLNKHAGKAIVSARFMGPVSWVMPFLAGTAGVSFRPFAFYSLLGCCAASSQFIILGYLFYHGLSVLQFLEPAFELSFWI